MSATRWLRIKAHAGRVLLACLVVSAVASVFWFRRLPVGDQQQAPAGVPVNDTKAEMVTRDFRHVETRMDRTVWVLESDRAELFEEKANLHKVKITWYGEPGDVAVVITSAEGTVDFRQRKARLLGNVRLERADGAVMSTEEILWNDKRKVLRAPSPVVISTPNFTVRGESLVARLRNERITLRGKVNAEIRAGSLVKSRPS